MQRTTITIRQASPQDAAALAAIYAPYVAETAITFEYEAPSADEFAHRIGHTLERYPYLVACDEQGTALGYAYAGPFKARPAYDWSVETSIYVAREAHGQGIGTMLHARLARELSDLGFQEMCACITAPPEGGPVDPYVTNASIAFHTHLGYRMVGRFLKSGYKFGRWHDMVWMELAIGGHPTQPPHLPWQRD